MNRLEKIADSIVAFFKNKHNKKELLRDYGPMAVKIYEDTNPPEWLTRGKKSLATHAKMDRAIIQYGRMTHPPFTYSRSYLIPQQNL